MPVSIANLFSRLNRLLARLPECLIILSIRLLVFRIFWFSVQEKINGWTIAGQHFAFWNVNNQTLLDFEFVYKIPFLSPTLAAHLSTWSQFFLALMILLGFMTRLASLGLLLLTLVIAYCVNPSGWWETYVYWSVCLLVLMASGGSKLSLDHLFGKGR